MQATGVALVRLAQEMGWPLASADEAALLALAGVHLEGSLHDLSARDFADLVEFARRARGPREQGSR